MQLPPLLDEQPSSDAAHSREARETAYLLLTKHCHHEDCCLEVPAVLLSPGDNVTDALAGAAAALDFLPPVVAANHVAFL